MNNKEIYINNPFSIEQTIRAKVIFENVKDFITGKDLLDLGIGDGICFKMLQKLPRSYDVVDSSKELIESFELDETKVNFYVSSFEDFPPRKYDCIIMGCILEHVDDPRLILNKYKFFLNPGGKVFVDVPNGYVLNRQIAVHAGMLESVFQLTETDIRFGHKRIFSIESISSLVEDCGYRVLKTTGIFLKPITSAQMSQIGFSKEIYDALGVLGKKYPDLANTILLEIEPCE